MMEVYVLVVLLSMVTRYASGTLNVARYSASPVQYHIQTDTGADRYFRYQTTNGQWRREKRLRNGRVVGAYGWTDGRGILRLYDYLADHDGYRVVRQRNFDVRNPQHLTSLSSLVQHNHKLPKPDRFPSARHNPLNGDDNPLNGPDNWTKGLDNRPNDADNWTKGLDNRQNEQRNGGNDRKNGNNWRNGNQLRVSTLDTARPLTASQPDKLDSKLSREGISLNDKRRRNYQKARNYGVTNAGKDKNYNPNSQVYLAGVENAKNLGIFQNEIVPALAVIENEVDEVIENEVNEVIENEVDEVIENEVDEVTENEKRDKRRSDFDQILDAGERRQIARGKKLFPLFVGNNLNSLQYLTTLQNKSQNRRIKSDANVDHDIKHNILGAVQRTAATYRGINRGLNRGSSVGTNKGVSDEGKRPLMVVDGSGSTEDHHFSILDTSDGGTVTSDDGGTVTSHDGGLLAPTELSSSDEEIKNSNRVHVVNSSKKDTQLERGSKAHSVVNNFKYKTPSELRKMNLQARVPMSRQLRASFVATDASRTNDVTSTSLNTANEIQNYDQKISDDLDVYEGRTGQPQLHSAAVAREDFTSELFGSVS